MQNYKKLPISDNFKNENSKNISTKYIIYILKLAIILLYIINFFLYNLIFKKFKININENYYKDPLNDYSLYNLFKYPQISILIIDIDNWKIKLSEIQCLINYFINQKLKDIEILFNLQESNNKNVYNIIKKYSLIEKRIKIYSNNKTKFIDKMFYLINKLEGKFTLIINKFLNLQEDELEKFYNLTKGNPNNIFKFDSSNNNKIYLIKSKILKNISDLELEFINFNSLINYIIMNDIPKLNYIYVSLALNDHYSSLAYVSMISILTNKEYYTYISFYLIVPNDFNQKNIDFIKSLYDQFDYFNITFIKMDNRYEKAFISRHISQESYYRFSLGELLTNLNKIIYLDSDTIIFRDLVKFYNLNFKGKIILGQVTGNNKSKQNHIYKINCGILLLNLKGMRKINMEKKVITIINNGFKSYYHDQSLLNKYFYKYIGIYPPEFHTRILYNYERVKKWNKKSGNIYDNDYLYFAWKYPSIRHYLGRSKYRNNNFIKFYDWWYYARKSKYYKKKTTNIMQIFNFTN